MVNIKNEILVLLRNNIKQVINHFESEKEKTKLLEDKNTELEKKIKKLIEEKEQLTIQNNTLKLAKSIGTSFKSNHDAKLKVNRIVREIDNCIALLNK